MEEITITFDEVLARYEYEPSLKDLFVEGVSDKYLIEDFLSAKGVYDISVFEIDSVDFEEVYKGMEPEEAKKLHDNNKNRVSYLSKELDRQYGDKGLKVLCIIDVDEDFIFGIDLRNRVTAYTDYNSMDMYLFTEKTIGDFLKKTLRIRRQYNVADIMKSLSNVCRQLYFINFLRLKHSPGATRLDNDKDFSSTKSFELNLDFESYWTKSLQRMNLMGRKDELKAEYNKLYANTQKDARLEMKGHDFVKCFYLAISKAGKKPDMGEDIFANVLWGHADQDYLAAQPLFQRILAL